MRFKIVCPQYVYYLSVFVYVGGAGGIAYAGKEVLFANQLWLAIFLYAVAGLAFVGGIFTANKFIFGFIDVENDRFIYGNMFFKQETPLPLVNHVGHYLFYRNVLKMEIAGNQYFIHNVGLIVQILLKTDRYELDIPGKPVINKIPDDRSKSYDNDR